MISCLLEGPLLFCLVVYLFHKLRLKRRQQLRTLFSLLYITPAQVVFAQYWCNPLKLFLNIFPLWLGNYLSAVTLGRWRGGGALVNWSGGLVDRRGAPLLRAHGAAMVVLVVRHGGHQLAPWTSLSTGPCRSGASSGAVSQAHCLLFIWRKKKKQFRKLH